MITLGMLARPSHHALPPQPPQDRSPWYSRALTDSSLATGADLNSTMDARASVPSSTAGQLHLRRPALGVCRVEELLHELRATPG